MLADDERQPARHRVSKVMGDRTELALFHAARMPSFVEAGQPGRTNDTAPRANSYLSCAVSLTCSPKLVVQPLIARFLIDDKQPYTRCRLLP